MNKDLCTFKNIMVFFIRSMAHETPKLLGIQFSQCLSVLGKTLDTAVKMLQCGDFCGQEPGMVDIFCTFG